MRTVLRLFAITIAAPFLMAQANAPELPTVEEILAHYEHAMGGKTEFAKVNTWCSAARLSSRLISCLGRRPSILKLPTISSQ